MNDSNSIEFRTPGFSDITNSQKTIICLQTPIGPAVLEGTPEGVSKISILDNFTYDTSDILEVSPEILQNSAPESTYLPESLRTAAIQLHEYFTGSRTMFSFEIALEGTEFQKKVWQQLMKIPFGKTVSYLDLSRTLGDVKAIRAVASANGRNPLWIVIPCHRVIGTDGSLTGYAGGLWRKKWLLEHENPPKQTSLF